MGTCEEVYPIITPIIVFLSFWGGVLIEKYMSGDFDKQKEDLKNGK